jgi:WD40 repeat protein
MSMLSIFRSMFNSNLRENVSNQVPTDSVDFKVLPSELLTHILSFLAPQELKPCSYVSRQWNDVTHNDAFLQSLYSKCKSPDFLPLINRGYLSWKDVVYYAITHNDAFLGSKYPQDVREDFSPLVEKGYLSWRDVAQYALLSPFFACALQKRYDSAFIKRENPFFDLELESYVTLCMPQPYFKYGNVEFSICNSTDIKIQKKGETGSTILPGEEGKMLAFLASENNELFALRQDGVIVRWNVQKGTIIDNIETNYSRQENADLKRELENGGRHGSSHSSFHVQNGQVILTYYSGVMDVIEIISYSDPKQRQLIKEFFNNLGLCMTQRILIYEGKLFILQKSSIFVWNLATGKKESPIKVNMTKPVHNYLLDMAIDKNSIYVTDYERKLYIIDMNSGKEIKSYYINSGCLDNIEVICNFLFISDDTIITILNINTGKSIRGLRVFDEDREQSLKLFVEVVKGEELKLPPK